MNVVIFVVFHVEMKNSHHPLIGSIKGSANTQQRPKMNPIHLRKTVTSPLMRPDCCSFINEVRRQKQNIWSSVGVRNGQYGYGIVDVLVRLLHLLCIVAKISWERNFQLLSQHDKYTGCHIKYGEWCFPYPELFFQTWQTVGSFSLCFSFIYLKS